MYKQQSWRTLLGSLTENPQERQRITRELGIHSLTLTRWIRGDSNPRSQSLLLLLKAFPRQRELLLELLQKEFKDILLIVRGGAEDPLALMVPSAFYATILHTYTMTSETLRFTTLCDLILPQMLKQLDPDRIGMAVIIAQCMPLAQDGKIRSLRECMGRGTPPWPNHLEQQAILLGCESLVGQAVMAGHIMMSPDLRDKHSLLAGYRGMWEESAAAAPIVRSGKIAGSVLVSSTQPNFFQSMHLSLIQGYAELLAMAFEHDAYYETKQIELYPLPQYEVQLPYLYRFQQRVIASMMEAVKKHQHLHTRQAEQMVWQQVEEELIQLFACLESGPMLDDGGLAFCPGEVEEHGEYERVCDKPWQRR